MQSRIFQISLSTIFAIGALLTAAALKAQSPGSDPETTGKRVVENIAGRYWGWRYQKACTYYGALIFADATGNEYITRQLSLIHI